MCSEEISPVLARGALPVLQGRWSGHQRDGRQFIARRLCRSGAGAGMQRRLFTDTHFPPPNLSPIEVGLAPVRWSTNDQFGVEFITLTPQDARRLQSYLALIESEPD